MPNMGALITGIKKMLNTEMTFIEMFMEFFIGRSYSEIPISTRTS